MNLRKFFFVSAGAAGLFAAGWAVASRWPSPAHRAGAPTQPAVVSGESATAVHSSSVSAPAAVTRSGGAVERLRVLLDRRRWTPRDLQRILRDAEVEEVPALLVEMDRLPHSEGTNYLQHGLVVRWAAVAPADALAWVQARSGREVGLLLNGVMSGWAERDPAAAAACVVTLTEPAERDMAAIAVAMTWAARDPNAAFVWAKTLPAGTARQRAESSVLQQMAQTDPARAIELSCQVSGTEAVTFVVAMAAGQLARSDLAQAMSAIDRLPSAMNRGLIYSQVVDALVEEDPKLAGDFALTLPAGNSQRSALNGAARGWSAIDPAGAIAWVVSAVPAGAARESALGAALSGMAENAPADAAKYYTAYAAGTDRTGLASTIAGEWAKSDAGASAAWAATLPAGESRASAVQSAVREWARREPAAALDFTLAQVPLAERSRVLRSLAGSWAQSAPEAALARINQLGGTPDQAGFVLGVLDVLVKSDPARASGVVAGLPAGDARDKAARNLADRFGVTEPAQGVAWIGTLTEPGTRQAAAAGLAQSWARRDAAATAQWLGTLPAGGARDAATDAFLSAAAPKQPQLAATVVAGISEVGKRNSATEEVAKRWLLADRAAAEAWLATTDLPEERKRKLLAPRG